MYVYIRVYRMYMYLYIIYSYVRVPRVAARVCHTYVINRESLPARAKWIVCIDLLPLERRKDAKLRRERRAEALTATRRRESDLKRVRRRVVIVIVRIPKKDANRRGSSRSPLFGKQQVTHLAV